MSYLKIKEKSRRKETNIEEKASVSSTPAPSKAAIPDMRLSTETSEGSSERRESCVAQPTDGVVPVMPEMNSSVDLLVTSTTEVEEKGKGKKKRKKGQEVALAESVTGSPMEEHVGESQEDSVMPLVDENEDRKKIEEEAVVREPEEMDSVAGRRQSQIDENCQSQIDERRQSQTEEISEIIERRQSQIAERRQSQFDGRRESQIIEISQSQITERRQSKFSEKRQSLIGETGNIGTAEEDCREKPEVLKEEDEEKEERSGRGAREVRRAQRGTSNVLALFSQAQIQEFKEAFTMIDVDRDGLISSGDLCDIYGQIGMTPEHKVLEEMLAEVPGPINFTTFLGLLGDKMKGTDSETTLRNAFAMFDTDGKGKLNAESFEYLLMHVGDQFSPDEIKQVWKEIPIDSGTLDYMKFVLLMKRGRQD